jgi:excisionase family DNA binding protein
MNDAVRWLKIVEAADRARCGPKTIYRAVRSGQLRAARIGGRRELRFLESWIDSWLLGNEIKRSEERGSTERRTELTPSTSSPTGPTAGY